MIVELHHYTWGMYLSPDGSAVAGNEKVIAASDGVSDAVRLRVREVVHTGLDSTILGKSDSYGFFPLGNNTYVACHYQASRLSEPVSRGRPVFIHYILVTEEALSLVNWNLLLVFALFTDIESSHSFTVRPPLSLETSQTNESWYTAIRANLVLIRTVLMKYLSEQAPVVIVSAPRDQLGRLRFLCGIVQTLPQELRQQFSFSSLSNPLRASARVTYSASDRIQHGIDWQVPGELTGPGSIYSLWIAEIAGLPVSAFQNEVATLRLPPLIDGDNSAMRCDLAVEFSRWAINPGGFKAQNDSDLKQLVANIAKFHAILNASEATEWLALLFTQAISLSARGSAQPQLEPIFALFSQTPPDLAVVSRIVSEVFETGYVPELAQFVCRLISLAKSDARYQYAEQFALDVVSRCLSRSSTTNNLEVGLQLWREMMRLQCAISAPWSIRLINSIQSLPGKLLNQVLAIVSIALDVDVVRELAQLIDRSQNEVRVGYPATSQLVEVLGQRDLGIQVLALPNLLGESLNETQELGWFLSATMLALKAHTFADFNSNVFITACDRSLGADHGHKFDIADLLLTAPAALDATEVAYLYRLAHSATKTQRPDLAISCMRALIRKSTAEATTSQAAFGNLLLALKECDAVRIVGYLGDQAVETSAMSASDLVVWMTFLKYLLDKTKLELQPDGLLDLLASAILSQAHVYRLDILSAIKASSDISHHGFSPAILAIFEKLIVDTISSRDLDVWVALSRYVSSEDAGWKPIYRRIVWKTLNATVCYEDAAGDWFQIAQTLQNNQLSWEGAVVTLSNVKLGTGNYANLSRALFAMLGDVQASSLTAEELGTILAASGVLVDTNWLVPICDSLFQTDKVTYQRLLKWLREQGPIISRVGRRRHIESLPQAEQSTYLLSLIYQQLSKYEKKSNTLLGRILW